MFSGWTDRYARNQCNRGQQYDNGLRSLRRRYRDTTASRPRLDLRKSFVVARSDQPFRGCGRHRYAAGARGVVSRLKTSAGARSPRRHHHCDKVAGVISSSYTSQPTTPNAPGSNPRDFTTASAPACLTQSGARFASNTVTAVPIPVSVTSTSCSNNIYSAGTRVSVTTQSMRM